MLVMHKSSRPAARMPRADYLAMDFKIKPLSFSFCLLFRLEQNKTSQVWVGIADLRVPIVQLKVKSSYT